MFIPRQYFYQYSPGRETTVQPVGTQPDFFYFSKDLSKFTNFHQNKTEYNNSIIPMNRIFLHQNYFDLAHRLTSFSKFTKRTLYFSF